MLLPGAGLFPGVGESEAVDNRSSQNPNPRSGCSSITTSQVYHWNVQPRVNLNTSTLSRNLVPDLRLLPLLAILRRSTIVSVTRWYDRQIHVFLTCSESGSVRQPGEAECHTSIVTHIGSSLGQDTTPRTEVLPSKRVRVLSEKNVLDKLRRSHDVVWDVLSLWSTRFSHVKTLERTRCRSETPQLARRGEGVVIAVWVALSAKSTASAPIFSTPAPYG